MFEPAHPQKLQRSTDGFRALVRRGALGLALGILAGWQAPPLRAETVTVAASTDNFPYSFADEHGRVAGFGVELLDAVAAELELTLDRTALPGMEERKLFAEGRFRLRQLHARENARTVDAEYSTPVLTLGGALFVRRGERRFRSLDDLKRIPARIAAPPQGHGFALAEGIPEDRLVRTSSEECLRLLAAGKVDAAILTRLTGLAQARRLGIDGLETAQPVLRGFTVRYCIAAQKGDTELIQRINEVLPLLHQNGKYAEIYERWFATYEPAAGVPLEQLVGYVTAALALGLVFAVGALFRQRRLTRRLAEQAAELRESRRILDEAQAFAKVGHWRRALVPDHASEWSPETYRIFDRDPAAGVPTREELIAYAVPEQRDDWARVLRRAAEEGAAYDLDVTVVHRDGSRHVVHVRGRAVADEHGRRVEIFGTAQDVTAWRHAEAELRRSELFLRALYDSLPEAVTVGERRDGEWHILAINRACAQRFRLGDAFAPGSRLRDLGQPPERVAVWVQLADRCVASGETIQIESHRDEPPADFRFVATPLPGGPHPRCLVLTEEITERRRQEAEIAQGRRLRAIGELVGGIAHEFNNLLTPVALNAEMLLEDWRHEPELAAQLQLIAEAARRSAALTRRLLGFGRKNETDFARIDLPALVREDVELIRRTIDRRIDVDCRLADALPELCLDAGDVHQVLLNLLFNARDTLEEKLAAAPAADWRPAIVVAAVALPAGATAPLARDFPRRPTGWIRLSVGDNGTGMTPETVERIFEPFYTTKAVGKGTGLGLATVWHVLTEMGGRIDVESRPGAGSTFHVCLPVFPAPAGAPPPVAADPAAFAPRRPTSPAAAPGPTAPAEAANGRPILLVEDEDAVAQVVEALLRRGGHRVTRADDGLRGWEILQVRADEFALLLLDLNMPGLHGREVVRRARAAGFRAPIVVMSGRISDDEHAQLLADGATHTLNKPFSLEELQRVLDAVFAAA